MPRDPAAIRTRADAERFLLSRVNYERRAPGRDAFRLDGLRALLSELGDPHLRVPAVHIAGTKGKGSTAILTAAALTACGHRTGLFTSPHLTRFEERLTVDGAEPDEATFVRLTTDVAAAAERAEAHGATAATFFEFAAALGFLHFARSSCDLAVLEVGLGGRLDATNLCRPVVCGVTTISREHTAILGETLPEIAREKAGIAKPGVPLVWGGGPGEAGETIRGVCAAVGAPFLETDPAGPTGDWAGLPPPPGGAHQRQNLATAGAILEVLRSAGWAVTPACAAAGMSGATLPGRAEFVPPPVDADGNECGPGVIFDVAHNPASAAALAAVLAARPEPGRRCGVFACARDKDAAAILTLLRPCFDELTLTRFTANPRATPLADLLKIVESLPGGPVRVEADPRAAWSAAVGRAGVGGLAVAAGSFFLVAELR